MFLIFRHILMFVLDSVPLFAFWAHSQLYLLISMFAFETHSMFSFQTHSCFLFKLIPILPLKTHFYFAFWTCSKVWVSNPFPCLPYRFIPMFASWSQSHLWSLALFPHLFLDSLANLLFWTHSQVFFQIHIPKFSFKFTFPCLFLGLIPVLFWTQSDILDSFLSFFWTYFIFIPMFLTRFHTCLLDSFTCPMAAKTNEYNPRLLRCEYCMAANFRGA